MSEKTARFLSYLFHPLFTPMMGMLLLMFVYPYSFGYQLTRISLIMVFITTMVFPATAAYFLLKIGVIRSLRMENAEERRFPFMVSITSYLLLTKFFSNLALPFEFVLFAAGAAISSLIALLFLSYQKISIHLLAVGGIVAALMSIADLYYINVVLMVVGLFLLSGFLGVARLRLHAHTLKEVYLGFSVGFIVEFVLLNYAVRALYLLNI